MRLGRRAIPIGIHREAIVDAAPLVNAGTATLRRDGNAKAVLGTLSRERKCGEAGGQGTGREHCENARHKITPSTRLQPYSPYPKPENLAALFPGKNRRCAILPHQSRGKPWLLHAVRHLMKIEKGL